MRKHIAWYVRGLYDNSTLCREVNHAKSNAEVEDLLRRYLEKIERAPMPYTPPTDEGGDFDETACDDAGARAH
jgi:hypothetical protein